MIDVVYLGIQTQCWMYAICPYSNERLERLQMATATCLETKTSLEYAQREQGISVSPGFILIIAPPDLGRGSPCSR